MALKIFTLLALFSFVMFSVQAQQAQMVPAANDLKNGVDTVRPAPQSGQKRGLMPMVDVNKENNQSKVDVHVPIFFDMTNLNNPDKSKLDLSVLQGLITVQKDKERDQDGQMNGPMKVTVFGIPVYTSKGNSRIAESLEEPIRESRRQLENSISQSRAELTSRADELSHKLSDQFQAANNKLMSSLSSFLNRMSGMINKQSNTAPSSNEISASAQQQPTANVQQRPLGTATNLTNVPQPMRLSKPLNGQNRLENDTFAYA